jgi:DNA-binding response OmpR family regulator
LSETTNWRIRQAADGREALGKLDETVDVVVLDRDMPHLSGDEVVQRLPQTTFAGQVVVLSASDPDASLNGEFVDSYLHKPLSPQALVAHLESVV